MQKTLVSHSIFWTQLFNKSDAGKQREFHNFKVIVNQKLYCMKKNISIPAGAAKLARKEQQSLKGGAQPFRKYGCVLDCLCYISQLNCQAACGPTPCVSISPNFCIGGYYC
jgi:hypothetical protein